MTVLGLVGEWNCGGYPVVGELAHLSMCSGFTGVVMGLEGSGESFIVACGGGGGGGVVVGGAFSMGVLVVVVSEAQDWGLLAVVLPGEEAVA